MAENMCAAVRAHKEYKCGNTWVLVNDYVSVFVFLHGNCIYSEVDGKKSFSLAGWNTNTTRSRLNALGVSVSQKNFAPMYNGKEIDCNKWYNI